LCPNIQPFRNLSGAYPNSVFVTCQGCPTGDYQPAVAVHILLSNRSDAGRMLNLVVELVSACSDLSVVKFMSGCVKSCANLYPDLRLFGEVGNADLRYRPRVAAND